MKLNFANGSDKVEVIDPNHALSSTNGKIYLDKSVIEKLKEDKKLEENILVTLEFIVFEDLSRWEIKAPTPISESPGVIASFLYHIGGKFTIQINDNNQEYICQR